MQMIVADVIEGAAVLHDAVAVRMVLLFQGSDDFLETHIRCEKRESGISSASRSCFLGASRTCPSILVHKIGCNFFFGAKNTVIHIYTCFYEDFYNIVMKEEGFCCKEFIFFI